MAYSFIQEMTELLLPVNEVYFGSGNRELDALQKQFSKFRENWLNKGKYNRKINTDPELQKFNRMIEKFFGFKTFALVVEPESAKNAYTFPLSGKIDIPVDTSKYLIKTNTGYKYSKEAEYSCMVFINSSFIVDSSFTDREVMAIIFHEIGHNFQQNFNPASTVKGCLMKGLNLAFLPIRVILMIVNPLSSEMQAKSIVGSIDALNKNVLNATEKMKNEVPGFVEAIYMIKSIGNIFKNVVLNAILLISNAMIIYNPLGSIINMIYSKAKKLIDDPLNILMAALGYNGEKLSDEFATIYGYGPELASAFEKMDFGGNTGLIGEDIWSDSLLNNFIDLFQLPVKFLFDPFEEHPETISRANNQLKLLEKELTKNGIDPKMKRQIEADIKEIKKTIDLMTIPDIKDGYIVRRAYAALLLKTCGGDIRELFNKNKPVGNYDKFEDDPVAKVKFK